MTKKSGCVKIWGNRMLNSHIKSKTVMINRSALPFAAGEYDIVVLNARNYLHLLEDNEIQPQPGNYELRIAGADDMKIIERLNTDMISEIYVPYHQSYSPNEFRINNSIKFVCDSLIADRDTPLNILEDQISELLEKGYDSIVIEVYSDQNSPIESLIDTHRYKGELIPTDIQKLTRDFPVFVGLANTKLLDLTHLPKMLRTDPIYLFR